MVIEPTTRDAEVINFATAPNGSGLSTIFYTYPRNDLCSKYHLIDKLRSQEGFEYPHTSEYLDLSRICKHIF